MLSICGGTIYTGNCAASILFKESLIAKLKAELDAELDAGSDIRLGAEVRTTKPNNIRSSW